MWEDDIVDIIANHPEVKYRYLIRPQKELLPSYELLEVSARTSKLLLDQG